MRRPSLVATALCLPVFVAACRDRAPDGDLQGAVSVPGQHAREVVENLVDSLGRAHEAEISVYYRSPERGDSILIRPDVRMHAASTMKVPVLLQLYLDQEAGRLDLDDFLIVETSFRSIADGSRYELDRGSDSDSTLYARAGEKVALRELADLMITRSSNLATNLLIREVDAGRVTTTMRRLGADSMEVLRGVEDIPAFEAGLNNRTTARDLGVLFRALIAGTVASDASRDEMIGILERQRFRDKIPAGLPAGVRVANKTGWITGISHDAAVVYPPADPPYVLVVLTRGIQDQDEAAGVVAEVSRQVWRYHTRVS